MNEDICKRVIHGAIRWYDPNTGDYTYEMEEVCGNPKNHEHLYCKDCEAEVFKDENSSALPQQ